MSADQDDLLEQALEWCVLLQDIDASEEQRQQAIAWREQSDAHRVAWQRAIEVWQHLDPLVEVLTAPVAQPARPRHRFRPALACAASLLLAALVVQLYDPAWRADYRTAVAQQQRWQLEDGSWVELAADSALDIDYSSEQRRIRLHRGQAWFQVVADAQRPFIVQAAGGNTQALGTAFAVRLRDQRVRVAVSEHSVQVSLANQRQILQQGQALGYDRNGLSQPVAVNLNSEMAWRQQRLVFQDTPLAEVLDELQHYLPAHLRLTDGRLGQLPVTVVIDTRQPEKALASLAEVLSLQLTSIGSWLILVSPLDASR
ncbi:FecR family protein [Phytopseudomonas daroniae]|uniref:FecR family protein n=1 Tax=Phytopseudomonas daroniae TaxID=2487519 RepID=UPI0010383A43|nr:FecR family protein [Pseudomonas daroniae]TBU75441.1 iron dicitrate transport regulator FecR [Pseudomonas daroniae]